MIVLTQIAWLYKSIPCPFQARPPVYALKRAHIQAINLCCTKVSQPNSFILFANLVTLFCARFKALTYLLCVGPNTPLHTQVSVSLVLCKLNILCYYFAAAHDMQGTISSTEDIVIS